MKKWEKFELSVSRILHDNDFDFFYQFEIPMSRPDFYDKIKRVPDYVAVYKGLYLVIDTKVWNEIITPPALHSASGKVGHTIAAIDRLFWDTCLFETGLLDYWTAKCPLCGSKEVYGNALYIKGPEQVGDEDISVYVDKEGTPFKYFNFSCQRCSQTAEIKGFAEPHFRCWELFPTVVPLIVSKTPFKTDAGFQPIVQYLAPSGGYTAIMGEAMTHCNVPKHILMSQIDTLDKLLKTLVSQRQYPQTPTVSLDELKEKRRGNRSILDLCYEVDVYEEITRHRGTTVEHGHTYATAWNIIGSDEVSDVERLIDNEISIGVGLIIACPTP